MKWWVGIISCVALFAFIGFFGYEKMSFIFRGVKIQAQIVQDGSSTLATVKGVAEKATHITLNGREIFIDKDGNLIGINNLNTQEKTLMGIHEGNEDVHAGTEGRIQGH